MPATKHNMTAAKWITILITIVSTVVGALTINWAGIIKFGHSMNFVYENADELDHIVEDFHDVLSMQDQINAANIKIDSLNYKLFVASNRDSLIHIIELLNRGKIPYDSIWRKSESGHWYVTTVDKHFREEHNN
jgi:hypothetical protein